MPIVLGAVMVTELSFIHCNPRDANPIISRISSEQ